MSDFECPPYSKAGFITADSDDDNAIVTGLAFSPRGDQLAVSSMSESAAYARVYSVSDLTLRWTHSLSKVEASCLIWHSSSKSVIIGNQEGDVQSASLDTSEPNDPKMNWGAGETRAFAISGNLLAVGCEACVSILEMGSHRSSTWHSRKDVHFVGDEAGSGELDLRPAGLAFTRNAKLLVVTYEFEGIVIYDAVTAEPVHRVRTLEPCCSSALSPRDNKLFVVNQDEILDVYTINGAKSGHEASLNLSAGMGTVSMFVPILCVHGGAGVLVGGMLGVVRILSATPRTKYGATLQTYRTDTGNKAIQEIVMHNLAQWIDNLFNDFQGYVYAPASRRHYIAFGTADDEWKNGVTIFVTEPQPSTIRQTGSRVWKFLRGLSYVFLAVFLVASICLGILCMVQLCWGSLSLDTLIPFSARLRNRGRTPPSRGRQPQVNRRHDQYWLI
ncbi:hypothetical protein PENSPDRAFT_693604 [Peniophora sp. CONT]|nr:hypothetical protein PENSPDRAFT_693604 [Peniophora sp. CONT]